MDIFGFSFTTAPSGAAICDELPELPKDQEYNQSGKMLYCIIC
jgi:hypothetical protein